MAKTNSILVKDVRIAILLQEKDDYISLTDMTKGFEGGSKLIEKWLNTKSTIDYIGCWETLNNPDFNSPEFGGIKMETGSNKFYISVQKFIDRTNAKCILAKAGRYGGTYAHTDIAFHFAMWLSPEFNLLVIKEFQRLKEQEQSSLATEWDVKRMLSKTNYTLHTDAIKDVIIPKLPVSEVKKGIVYATEADLLNLALFGCRAKDWEASNPTLALQGKNIRDTASINQLVVLSNMEVLNSEMIKMGIDRMQRLNFLHKMAKEQMAALDKSNAEQRFRKLMSDKKKGELPDK